MPKTLRTRELYQAAAKAAFETFLDARTYAAAQIDFVCLVIDELTQTRVLEVGRLCDDPYTGVAPEGPEALFTETEIDKLIR